MQLLDIVKKGVTDRSVVLRIIDSADGTPETGVVYNTSGIDLWYRREGAAKTSITEATLAALTTAHADGGFLHISDGVYRLDLPDAAFATSANYVDVGGTVTGMIVIGGRVRLVDIDLEDTVRLGMTALPNAAAEASGGLYTRGTGAGQIKQDANGRIDANVRAWLDTAASTPTVAGVPNVNAKTWNDLATVALPLVPTTAGRTLDVSATGEAGVDWANVGSPTTSLALTGTTIATTQKVDLETIKTNPVVNAGTVTFPTTATLASTTNITAGTIATATNVTTVNGLAAGVITAASIAADAITDAKVASDVTIASVTGAVGSVTGAVGSVTGAVGSVTGAVGSVTGNVGGNVTGSVGSVATGGITTASFAAGAIDAAAIAADAIGASELAADAVAEIADQVWDEVLSGHLTGGTTGAGLNAAGSAGDPWSTAIPGAYSAGSAGKIVGDNLNATVSSRASQTSVDDVPTNAELATALGTADDAVLVQVALVKAQTDLIPSDPADASDVAAAFSTVNSTLATIAGYLDTEIAAIKAVTDQFAASQSEPIAVPAANASPLAKIAWLAALARNKVTQTATTQTLKADDGTTTIATATVSDDATTFERSEWV